MATYSSIFAWKIPWTEELGRQRSIAKSQTRLKRLSSSSSTSPQETVLSIYNKWVFTLPSLLADSLPHLSRSFLSALFSFNHL